MYCSNETLTDVNSLPYDQHEHYEQSQTESHLNLQLSLAVQEKEAATEMLRFSQMTLNNLEEVLDERRKSSSVDYIKNVKEEYSEAILLLNNKIDSLSKQVTRLQEENHQYRALNKDLEFDYQQIREKNAELEQELGHQVKTVEEMLARDRTHETVTSTLLSIDTVNKEKQDLVEKLKQSEQENSRLSEKFADLEHTGDRMEEALRNSEQKLREYKIKEANYLEAIGKYVRDLNEMKDEVQKINLKLQEQKMESKAALFELQQEMAGVIADLGFEKTVLLNEKASLQNEVSQLSKALNKAKEHLNQLEMGTIDRSLYGRLQDQLSELKQQKFLYQNESAQMLHEVECLNNQLTLERQSFDSKISLTQYQVDTLDSALQDSRQHCQQLIEENLELASQLTQLRAQLGYYHKMLEENSLLSVVEKCQQLEDKKRNQVKELEIYVAKYRDQMKSWKDEWQNMADRFQRTLQEYRSQNEALRIDNTRLRQYSTVKCKIKMNDVT